jgi:hypothetical protein
MLFTQVALGIGFGIKYTGEISQLQQLTVAEKKRHRWADEFHA